MRRTLVLGCAALFAVGGCGKGSAKPDGGDANGGDANGGGAGGSGPGGGGAAGTGTAGAGSAGTGTAGTGTGGTGGTGPSTVTLASADALVFAAGQDGDGAWQALTPDAGQSYTLQVAGARYGLAYACARGNDSIVLTIVQATVAETTRVSVACGTPVTLAEVNVTVNFAGLIGTQNARLEFGPAALGVSAAMPTFSGRFQGGTHDLFARRLTGAQDDPTFDRMIRRNSLTIIEGTSLSFDFATDGFAPETRTVTLQGTTASDTTGLLVIFRNVGGTSFSVGTPSPSSYFAIPAGQLRSGDYHSVEARASDSVAIRRVRRLFIAAMNFTAVFPVTPPAVTTAAEATTPYIRPRITLPAGLGTDRYDVTFNQFDPATFVHSRSWSVQFTRGWAASFGAADYTVPDLSGVSGFQTSWGLIPNPPSQPIAQHFANWSDAGVADLLRVDQTAAELDGREYKSVGRATWITF